MMANLNKYFDNLMKYIVLFSQADNNGHAAMNVHCAVGYLNCAIVAQYCHERRIKEHGYA